MSTSVKAKINDTIVLVVIPSFKKNQVQKAKTTIPNPKPIKRCPQRTLLNPSYPYLVPIINK